MDVYGINHGILCDRRYTMGDINEKTEDDMKLITWTQEEIVRCYEKNYGKISADTCKKKYAKLTSKFNEVMNNVFSNTKKALGMGDVENEEDNNKGRGRGYYFISTYKIDEMISALQHILDEPNGNIRLTQLTECYIEMKRSTNRVNEILKNQELEMVCDLFMYCQQYKPAEDSFTCIENIANCLKEINISLKKLTFERFLKSNDIPSRLCKETIAELETLKRKVSNGVDQDELCNYIAEDMGKKLYDMSREILNSFGGYRLKIGDVDIDTLLEADKEAISIELKTGIWILMKYESLWNAVKATKKGISNSLLSQYYVYANIFVDASPIMQQSNTAMGLEQNKNKFNELWNKFSGEEKMKEFEKSDLFPNFRAALNQWVGELLYVADQIDKYRKFERCQGGDSRKVEAEVLFNEFQSMYDSEERKKQFLNNRLF